ncbi:fork head domain-containing protein [Ilyonectria robusta]
MPDAPALDGFDATPRPAEPQPQATPVQQQLHLHHDTAMAAPDHFAPSTPFTPAAIPSLDQHAYMMMALASMSGAPSAMSPPPTVTPSQVTLPNPMDEAFHGLAPANAIRQAGADKALESFARVEFADSVFQMTTYAVIIGRDQRALEQARRDEKRADEHRRRVEDNANRGLPPPSPIAYERGKFSKSYVSEEGGMLGPESDNGENGRPAKRRKTSTQGSSQNENDEAQQAQENMISNRQYVSHTPGAAAVDLTSLRPSPWHVPFIGIHSPGPNIATKTKAISREHLKIAYNQEEGVFEAIPLHKNGFFCEDVHYKSEKVVLKCGDRLQIKDIDFRFLINGVERGCTGAEEDVEEITPTTKKRTHGGKEMSFDFESSHGNGEMPKKRGPGRPPKNGIMSKREQRLLKKQQQEMAKKTLPQAPPVEPPIKRKVGRPRKHPLPENSSERPEKRKYKPRKPKNEDGAEGSDAERRAREKKEKKARPKSPPLELKIEDYTEEQLQKPNKNYGVLIDETLTAAGPDGLTLKQIYKRICQRYPWFYFHTETKGWESSVRHNLIGNEAFKKDETTNLWSRVPGVELDAGKKRKASSPDRGLAAAQAYGQYPYPYNAAQHIPPGAPGYHPPSQAPPVYQVPAYNAQQGQPGRPVQPYGASASPPGQPVLPVASQLPAPAQLPGYGPPPAPARPQLGAPQPGAYSSPYARPPPSATPPIKNEDGHAPAAVPPAQQPAAAPIAAKTVPGPNGLVENLKKARNPKAEAIVMSALNRCIGLKKEATENDKMETICMKGIRQVIDGFTKTKSPTPGAGPSSSDAPPIFEAKVLASLTGFKDVSIKALKAKLGESKAEAVTLSAIDRVLGLADASIVPPPAEGEPSVGNFEGVEQHLIKSIRQLLTGMNQKLQGVGA